MAAYQVIIKSTGLLNVTGPHMAFKKTGNMPAAIQQSQFIASYRSSSAYFYDVKSLYGS